jgi:bacteriocin biosynthesis cyclodehydratase domain-containing protein
MLSNDSGPLRLKRSYSVVPHSADVVELRWGVWNTSSVTIADEERSGFLYRTILRLDGSMTPRQLALAEGIPYEAVERLVDHLAELGALESGSGTALDHYLDQIVPTLRSALTDSFKEIPVKIVANKTLLDLMSGQISNLPGSSKPLLVDEQDPAWRDPLLDRGWMDDGLRFVACAQTFSSWRGHLVVIVQTDLNPLLLEAWNKIALENTIPWMLGAFDGPFVFVGPTFLPKVTACFDCLETRVLMNLKDSGNYQNYKTQMVAAKIRYGTAPIEPAVYGLLASHMALEIKNFSMTKRSFTLGKILGIYLPTMEFAFSDVLRVPGCRSCSSLPERDETELHFDVRTLLQSRSAPSRR